MRTRSFRTAIALALATMALPSCSDTSKAQPDASTPTDASVATDASVPHGDFELNGSWLYLGPWDQLHTLTITNTSLVYSGEGGDWSSTFTLKDFDNDLQRFQMVFKSGNGSYMPTGQSLSGTYDLSGAILAIQLTNGLGSYSPIEASCLTAGSERIANCGRYMKQ
jgi:hypothetical protein